MSDAIKTFERNGYTANVMHDPDPPNPRVEHSNATEMICWHRKYTLGDKHDYREPDAFLRQRIRMKDSTVDLHDKVLPELDAIFMRLYPHAQRLYLLDHSGVTMQGSRTGNPFTSSWDSGQVGYIVPIAKQVHDVPEDSIDALVFGEISAYAEYLEGEVFAYEVLGPDMQHIDSLYGIFGREYAEKEAREALDREVERAGVERVIEPVSTPEPLVRGEEPTFPRHETITLVDEQGRTGEVQTRLTQRMLSIYVPGRSYEFVTIYPEDGLLMVSVKGAQSGERYFTIGVIEMDEPEGGDEEG